MSKGAWVGVGESRWRGARGGTPRCTETGEAPGSRGATREHTGPYVIEEQQSEAGCIAGRMRRGFRHGLLGPSCAAAVVRVAAAALIVAGSLTAPGVVEAAQPPAADGGFTADQAAAGWSVYARQCGECHGAGAGRDGSAAAARGRLSERLGRDRRRTSCSRTCGTRCRPALGDRSAISVYLNLVAYILDVNGARPGDAPLTADAAIMRSAMRRTWPRPSVRRGRASGRGGGRCGSSTGRCRTSWPR